MDLWLLAAVSVPIISAFVGLTDKYVVTKAPIRAYMLLIGAMGLLSLLLVPVTGAPWPTLAQWFLGIPIGVIFAILIYASFKAFQKEEISRLAPLAILPTIAITIGAAFFFDEHLTADQKWAFVLFLLGTVVLATRFEYKIKWFSDPSTFGVEKASKNAMKILESPLRNSQLAAERFTKSLKGALISAYDAAANPNITFIQLQKKLKLIKGLGWYLLALALTIPYTLLGKELNAGGSAVVQGFITIRVGLFIGSLFIIYRHKRELKQFFSHKKIVAIASVKELFGMLANFLALYAIAAGPVAVVRSIFSMDAVGIFLVGILLAKFGIIRESLKKRDIIQKSFGVAIMVFATLLMFVGWRTITSWF